MAVAAVTAAVAATLMVAYDASAAEFVQLTKPGLRRFTVSTPPVDSRLWPVDVPRGSAVGYTFDGGVSGSVASLSGALPLQVRTAAGGVLVSERHGSGLAVRFPGPCAVYGDESCPRAILESGPAGELNPGTGLLRYGAAVRLAASETTKGENVVQKGFSQGDSQYKLQIDGAEGRPSCVLVGVGSSEIFVLKGSASVADGQWHAIECVRIGSLLIISVDRAEAGRRNIPAENCPL